MFRIRVATVDDAEGVRDVYAPYVLSTAASFDIGVPSVVEIRDTIEQRLKQYPWLVAEDEGNVVGYAYAGAHQSRRAYRWSVDASVYIAESHQRRGIGRMFYNKLLPTLKRQGFRMVHAGITLPNDASVGLHESFGFQRVALYPNVGHKCGEWHDVGWWALDLMGDRDANGNPSEPLAFPDVGLVRQ